MHQRREAALVDCAVCEARTRSVFSHLTSEELELIDGSKRCLSYKKGEIIFDEGAYPHGLYCISHGKVKITQTGPEGREQIVHLANDADILGYRAILGRDRYSCTATSLEDSSLCYIPINVFYSIIERNPAVTGKVLSLFSNLLRNTEKAITSMAQRTVKARIAQSLLLLKECYGLEKDGITVNVSLTRQEIANISGATRETATRFLFEMDADKVISLSGKKIRLLKQDALLAEANVLF